MFRLKYSILLLERAIAELRTSKLDRLERFERWVNLCAALTTDLEAYYCKRNRQMSKKDSKKVA